MEKSNLELFKQALNEAWDNKIREEIGDFTEEIVTSERHKAAMKAILDGTYEEPKKQSPWKLTRTKVAAILVAAAVLLASCAIIYRNEIRDFVEEIFDDFSRVTYSGDDANGGTIEDVYELTYVPEGYVLEEKEENPTLVRYKFVDEDNNVLVFEQKVLDYSSFIFDIENGYTILLNTNNSDVYYKTTERYHYYLWNTGTYSMRIRSNSPISNEELELIFEGIRVK